MCLTTGWWGGTGRTATRVLWKHREDVDSTKCFRLHQQAYLQATGDVSPVDSPNRVTGNPNALCTSPTHTLKMAGCACMHLRTCSASFCRCLVSVHRKLAWLQDLKKSTQTRAVSTTRGKTNRRLSALGLELPDERSHAMLRIRLPRKRKPEVGNSSIHIKGLTKLQNP